jgi:methionyl-tRNA formyltransferase
MRIIFMGTPDFAVPSLKSLHAAGHDLALVVTQPDRPAGRGRRLSQPPVKILGLELGLTVEQPESVNTDAFAARLRELAPDLFVVVAFGQILRQKLLDIPSMGSVNVHGSLLPDYRGVAPINWAIVNGESETGVTTMYMAATIDTGAIIQKRAVSIGAEETAGELYERLASLGGELIVETAELIARGEAPRTPQGTPRVGYARKLKRDDGAIDWSRPARAVHDHIRGMTPWPGATTRFGGRMLLVTRSVVATSGEESPRSVPGTILSLDGGGIEVAVGDGSVMLTEVKPEGKRAMRAQEFVRGYRPEVGARLRGDEAGERLDDDREGA